jgi:uncharacterized protein
VSAPNVFDASKYAVGVVAACVTTLLIVGMSAQSHGRTLHLATAKYGLEVANNTAERAKGLGGRNQLGADRGMLFVYDAPAVQCFWMKDMHFAIDMVWADQHKQVTHIKRRVTPQTYPKTYCASARYVIELPAGAADRNKLRLGDALTF